MSLGKTQHAPLFLLPPEKGQVEKGVGESVGSEGLGRGGGGLKKEEETEKEEDDGKRGKCAAEMIYQVRCVDCLKTGADVFYLRGGAC